jgi:hypothetical protein
LLPRARWAFSLNPPKVPALMDQRPTWFSENGDLLLAPGGGSKSGGLGSEHELINLRKGLILIMSRRTLISLAASAIVGIACVATVSTDAFAYRRGVGVGHAGAYHGGVARGGVYRGGVARAGVYRGGVYGAPIARGVAVGLGAAAVGAAVVGTAAGPYGAYGAYSDPSRPYDYGYYGIGNGWPAYAARNGIVCQPGTWFRGQDGVQQFCQ